MSASIRNLCTLFPQSVFLAGLDASLIAITVTLFSSGFGKPVSPRSRPIYVFANLALIFAILSATLYTTMFVSQPMRNSIWIRTASFTLIASALSFTFGEAVHIMILLLGNDESRVPAFGYVLPLAVAGLVSAILLLAWAWWFTYDFRWFCAHLCGDSGRGPAEQARRAQHFEGGFFGSQY